MSDRAWAGRFGRALRGRGRNGILAVVLALAFVTAAVAVVALNDRKSSGPGGNAGLHPDQPVVNSHYLKNCPAATTCTTTAIASAAYSTFVVIAVGTGTTAPSADSISAGGTLGALKGSYTANAPGIWLYWVDNVTAQASVTATIQFASSTSYQVMALDVKFTGTVSLDNVGAGAHSAGSTQASCAATVNVANDLELLAVGETSTSAISATAGETLVNTSTVTSLLTGADLSEAQASTGTATMTANIAVSHVWSCIAFTLKVAPAPAAPTSFGMATAYVNSKTIASCSAVTTCTTAGIATTIGSALWVFIAAASVTAPSATPTDSAAYATTLIGSASSSTTSNREEYVYDANNLAAAQTSLTVTVTFAGSTTYTIGVLDVIGQASATSLNALGTQSTGSSTTASDTVTPLAQTTDPVSPPSHLLIVGVSSPTGTIAFTATGGDSLLQNLASGVTTGAQLFTRYTGTAQQTVSATLSSSEPWAAVAVAIQSASNPIAASQTIATCSAVTTCTTTGIVITQGSSVWVFIAAASVTAPSAVPTSSPANTFTLANSVSSSSTSNREEYVYKSDYVAGSASETVTETFAGSTTYTIGVVDVLGANPASLDVTSAAGSSGSSGTASDTATPAISGDFAILGVSVATGTVTVAASGSDTLLQKANAGVTAGAQLTQSITQGGLSTTLSATFTSAPWAAVVVFLAADAPTKTTVPLEWAPPNGPDVNDTVLQATYSAGTCGSYSTTYSAGAVQEYTVTGLTTGSTYCFEVEQWNSTTVSLASAAIRYVHTAAVAAAPTGLAVVPTNGATTAIDISWSNPATDTNVQNLTVYGVQAASCTSATAYTAALEVSVGAGTAFYRMTGLTTNLAYCVNLQIWNLTGPSAMLANGVAATTTVTPAAPTTLGTTGATATTVALSWSNPGGTIQNDTVDYSTNSACTATSVQTLSTGGSATAATVTALLQNQKYYFAVAAWVGGVEGTFTACLAVTTGANPPGAPTSFVVTSVSTTTISVSWVLNQPPPLATIQNETAYLGTVCGTWTQKNSLSSGSATTYTYSGLSTNTAYCVAIAEWDQGGIGALAYTNATTYNGAPAAPTGLTELAGSRTTISIFWVNPVGTIVNNTVYYTTGANCAGAMTAVSTVSPILNWTITGLAAFTTYHVAVTAWTNGGQSAQSTCVSMISQAQNPPAPVYVNQTSAGATWITISWKNPAGYILFNDSVQYHATTCASFTVVSMAGVTQSYNLTGLTMATTYCIEVIAWDGPSAPSQALLGKTAGFGQTQSTNQTNPNPLGPVVGSASSWPTLLGVTDAIWLGIFIMVGMALPSILTRFTRLPLDLLALAGLVVGSLLIAAGA